MSITRARIGVGITGLALCLGLYGAAMQAQGQAPPGAPPQGRGPGGGRANVPPPDPTKPHKLEIVEGSKARYKVREQLAGINFPSDAVGTTETVTGTIVINPDGTIDAAKSKLSVDLRTIKSDQQMRDGYIQGRTLETEKFPMIEFVPKRAVGLPSPLPAGMQAQAGFQLIGDMTLHGVTKPITVTIEKVGASNNPQFGERAGFFTMFKVKRSDFGMSGMTNMIGDEVELAAAFETKKG